MKYFGTDGFRGVAGTDLTVEHAYKIGRFIGWYYGARQGRKARIVVGKDTRRSSYMLESGMVSGLVASGADAYMLHVIPTPGLSYETTDGAFDCGVMITASHNPYTDNGIKLVNSQGFKMEEPLLQLIEQYIDGEYAEEVPMVSGDAIGATVDYMQGRNRYIAHLIASANFSLQGVKVGLDCANGAASSVAKPVLMPWVPMFALSAMPPMASISTLIAVPRISTVYSALLWSRALMWALPTMAMRTAASRWTSAAMW